MKRLEPTEANLLAAGVCIKEGGVVAYPTETVYGLGVDPFNVQAVERLFTIKGRPERAPFILIVADADDARRIVREMPREALQLIAHFWPGPLSLVLPKSGKLPAEVTGGADEVAIRCPGHSVARALCRAAGGPIVSTSLNRSGEAAALSLSGVSVEGIDLALDAGELSPSSPSTVYHVARRSVLREGPVASEAIASAIATAGDCLDAKPLR